MRKWLALLVGMIILYTNAVALAEDTDAFMRFFEGYSFATEEKRYHLPAVPYEGIAAGTRNRRD